MTVLLYLIVVLPYKQSKLLVVDSNTEGRVSLQHRPLRLPGGVHVACNED